MLQYHPIPGNGTVTTCSAFADPYLGLAVRAEVDGAMCGYTVARPDGSANCHGTALYNEQPVGLAAVIQGF